MTKRWYAIRTIYKFGRKGKLNIYEERIVVFSGKDWDEAWDKAFKESKEYSNGAFGKKYISHPIQSGYEQDGDKLIDGYEVWSELSESKLRIGDFYKQKYTRFEYKPPKYRSIK